MTENDTAREMLLVTGMSGAGRSTVAKALEDVGWYVVDNLPTQMLRPLVDLASASAEAMPRIAAVMDVRGGALFRDVEATLESLRRDATVRILFLDATDAALVRRFEQVRRPHPLQGDGTLLDGITTERSMLRELRSESDLIIDTSELNIHQLANRIVERFSEADDDALRLTVQSFGFKYGMPTDADLVADARFLPNPFWVPELRPGTGRDLEVSEYVLAQEGAEAFLDGYLQALVPVFAGYRRENKRHATIAIGCTGGKHRSVALAEELARRFREIPGVAASVKHRDLGRE
ncbi:RNase adapter RapZ [Homoserinibacter sp. YIM 151385]|uniref:RNase adapter RapZ n=1 Tax=Homoserinibacter sp. YIM 151385 TaxID=2985506 RepID=UPI0022F028F4|nr:RNase adapter RapZ [Homoserinibacter sp. YIM 151385]WBU38610.1 RNase adapter RapZ [Homoserinibacter sp. YIM 151385]